MTVSKTFASYRNLELGWRRIRTGQNIAYKKFFREIYDAFGISAKENISQLSKNILNGTYTSGRTERVFLPKPSGLQRPITLLNIEDQIVLQGIANIYAKKLFKRRVAVESKGVCSNRLNRDKNSIFFLKSWKTSYDLFRRRIRKTFDNGNHYVAEFDLASFYDTISHDLLIKVLAPRGGNRDFCDKIKDYFKKWTPEEISHYSHGIPQGLIASDFLAECFMLPLDEAMTKSKDFQYLRYVDDILLFGKHPLDVYKGVVMLEEKCRSIGLIPHAGKFAVKRLKTVEEILKLSVSLSHDSTNRGSFNQADAEKLFLGCLSPKHDFIADTSRAKYVLFRSDPNEVILTHCLRLFPKHPELIDAFGVFLKKFGERKKIANRMERLLNEGTPYKYVEGGYWDILSNCAKPPQADKFSIFALKRLQSLPKDVVAIRLGLYKFLSICQDKKATRKLFNCLSNEKSPLLQAMSISQLPYYSPENYPLPILKGCLNRKEIEPSIMTAYIMGYLGITTRDLGIKTREISVQAQNTLKDLGIIQRRVGVKAEPVGELLERRFKIGKRMSWVKLLKRDYKHANTLLIMAESSFESNPNAWMGCMDSFNDLVIPKIAEMLHNKGSIRRLPPPCDSKGRLIDYGNFLEPRGYFARNAPDMTKNLRSFHERRNHLPTSHPKDKRTQVLSRPLKHKERDKYVKKLEVGYDDMINFITNI